MSCESRQKLTSGLQLSLRALSQEVLSLGFATDVLFINLQKYVKQEIGLTSINARKMSASWIKLLYLYLMALLFLTADAPYKY